MIILNVSTTPIKTEINTKPASLDLHTTLPKVEINSQAAVVEIHQPEGELQIDQTPCRYAYGIKNMEDFTRDNAQEGMQAVLEGIGRIAEDGDRLARIGSKENAVTNLAAENSKEKPVELTWAYLPRPDIKYIMHPVEYQVTDGKVDVQLDRGTVEGDFKPGSVTMDVTQYPSVQTWTTENKVDLRS